MGARAQALNPDEAVVRGLLAGVRWEWAADERKQRVPARVIARLAANPAATVERILYALDRLDESRYPGTVGFIISAVEGGRDGSGPMEVPTDYDASGAAGLREKYAAARRLSVLKLARAAASSEQGEAR